VNYQHYAEGDRVSINPTWRDGHDGPITGTVRGIAVREQPIIGPSYIIELDRPLADCAYSCIAMFAVALRFHESDMREPLLVASVELERAKRQRQQDEPQLLARFRRK
jgi:hypothetical protein